MKESRDSSVDEVAALKTRVRHLEGEVLQLKQLEQTLKKGQEQLQKLFDHSNDAMLIIDLERDALTVANVSACKMFDYSHQELLSTPASQILPTDVAFVESVLEQGSGWTDELTCLTRGGHRVPVEMSASVIEVEGRQCMIAMLRNIAQRKDAEQALRQSEKRFRDLYDEAPTAYISTGVDGRILQANRSAGDLLGYAADQLLGRRVVDLGADTPTGKARIEENFRRFCLGEEIWEAEMEFRRADGSSVWVSLSVRPILDSEGRVVASRSIVVDLSARQRLEQTRMQESLRVIMKGTAPLTGKDFFPSLVEHLAQALHVRYAFVTECREQDRSRARSLAFWKGGRLEDNFEYEVAVTPCLEVLAGKTCVYSRNVQALFPDDDDLKKLGAESYLGVPLLGSTGEVIGHLVVLDDQPMEDHAAREEILKIFASRAAAELERLRAEEQLTRALGEVENLTKRLQAENVYLREEIHNQHNFEEIVGCSPSLLEVLYKVEKVAPLDSTVLIDGETGTGKELIARAIHSRSRRADRPLVKVDCGSISASLVESELFGHVKGAFTGAAGQRTGRFELADRGTLFLDEIGELPLEAQVKLLRILEEQEFEPVGSSRTRHVDVRVIAATNRDLAKAVKQGRYRSDLFYRLNTFPITVPPLRERLTDLPLLVTFFLSRYSKKLGKNASSISPTSMDLLMQYPWPGNIRELRNVIERAVVLSEFPVVSLDRDLLPAFEVERHSLAAAADGQTPVSLTSSKKLPDASAPRAAVAEPMASLAEVERNYILQVLLHSNWVVEGPAGAAQRLNLHPNTLRSRMKKLGIQRPG